MAVDIYVGRPGSGKTYTVTERAMREAKRGRPVFTNYPVKGCFLYGPDDLMYLPPGLIVIDEAHLWFSSRASLRLPASWLQTVSQTRKRGWDLMLTTQHESRLDRALRDISDWMWLCRAYGFPWSPGPKLFKATAYEAEFFRRPDKANVTTWRGFNPAVASAYDTHGQISFAEHTLSTAEREERKSAAGASSAPASSGARP